MTTSRLGDDGKIELPSTVLQWLNAQAGDMVIFDFDETGDVTMRKCAQLKVVDFSRLRGRAGKGLTTDQVMTLTRGT